MAYTEATTSHIHRQEEGPFALLRSRGSLAINPNPQSFRSTPADTPPTHDLGRELLLLHDQQQAAIGQAVYLGMTLEEENAFELRGLRIREILRTMGRS